MENRMSIVANKKTKSTVEKAAAIIVTICAAVSILAVISITGYMIIVGSPALKDVGIKEILFSSVWSPETNHFGILYIILTSLIGTALAIIIGVPIGLLSAVCLAEMTEGKVRGFLKGAIELLAGIPSVVYGLLGILIINPLMYNLEKSVFSTTSSHQFTGGSNLLAASLVLAIMILPTLISISETALESVPDHYRKSSLALGASKIQTIFRVVIPAAKNGIFSAIVLGVGRAIGEAMAIMLVAGNSVNLPLPFSSVRFLTTAIVSEMSYASGVHREVLFTIGLVLFLFIMLINLLLTYILKKGDRHE